MSTNQACLTENDIQLLERKHLSQSQLEQFENHLTDCRQCRENLDAFATDAIPQWQAEICPMLREVNDIGNWETQVDDTDSDETFLRLLSPSEDPAMLGRVGVYEVVGIIGQGGMGVVFKAFETSLNRFVAIKMLLPHLTANGAARKRFLREAQAAAAVVDDHVLPIFGVDEWQGTPYLVMKYSGGQTLQQRMTQHGPLEPKEILRIGLQAAKGLAAAHAQGLVHRDVKPSNILLDGSVDRAVLMDFGLARAADDASITRTGIISGTPQYMSPEQVRADSVDARSDLFSLGSTLYAMCTGRAPFRSESAYGVMHRITHQEPTPVCEVNSDIPGWLGVIIERLMCKNPADRFDSADEVAALLESCLAHTQQPTIVKLPAALASTDVNRGGFSNWKSWLAVLSFSFFFLFAGVYLMIELNKGKLVIECATDDVPIRILQGDTVVEKLSVTKEGATIRVAAGKYRVEVDGDHPEISIDNNVVTLGRGGEESVRIKLVDANENLATQKFDTPEALMQHYGESLFRSDIGGVLTCLDDRTVHLRAYSYLLSACQMEQLLIDSCDLSKNVEVASANVKQLQELQKMFDDAGVDKSARQAATAVFAAAEASGQSELSLEQMDIANLNLLKNPRDFLAKFCIFAEINMNDEWHESSPDIQPTYQITRSGWQAVATDEASGQKCNLVLLNGSWRILGDSFESAPREQLDSSSSPQKAFDRCRRMVEQKNWEAVRECITEDCLDEVIGECLFAFQLARTYNKLGSGDDEQDKIRIRIEAFLDNLHKQFPSTAKMVSERDLPSDEAKALKASLSSLDPRERRRAKIALVRQTLGDDREQIFVALNDFMYSLPSEDLVLPPSAVLVDVEVDSETATAVVVDGKRNAESVERLDDERQRIAFKKVGGVWKIDKLVESVFEQMRELEQEVQGINRTILNSALEEMRESGVSEKEIEKFERKIWAEMNEAAEPPRAGNEVRKQPEKTTVNDVTRGELPRAVAATSSIDVAKEVKRIVSEHESLSNGFVFFRLTESNSIDPGTVAKNCRVCIDGDNFRSDVEKTSSDAPITEHIQIHYSAKDSNPNRDTVILTPEYTFVERNGKVEFKKPPSGNKNEIVGLPQIHKFGLVSWWPLDVDSFDIDKHLTPDSLSKVSVTQGVRAGMNVTIVKFQPESGTGERSEFWLSTAHGNRPVYMKRSSDELTIEQHTKWKKYDQSTWFPEQITFEYRHDKSNWKKCKLETQYASFGSVDLSNEFTPPRRTTWEWNRHAPVEEQPTDPGTSRSCTEGMSVNEAANAKWGDSEPLEVAKRVFEARREMLKSFQLCYRTFIPSKEKPDVSHTYSTQEKAADGAMVSRLFYGQHDKNGARNAFGVETVGFSDSNVYYFSRPAKPDGPAAG